MQANEAIGDVPQQPTRMANVALGLDAGLCNLVGLVFVLAGALMADWLGTRGWVATVFGVVVLIWSFVVTLYANRKFARAREVRRVAKVNVVAAVAGTVVVAASWLSTAGRVVMLVGVVMVAGFAAVQFVAASRI